MNWRALLTSFVLLIAASPTWATTVLPLGLDDIVGNAVVAFQGTCTENRTEQDPHTNLIVTYTTFAVHDVIKGKPGDTYTIKQIGGEIPGNGAALKVHGVPTFTPGTEYVVFLPQASGAGFSSPVGLSQGRFTVMDEEGARKVANGRDFREMTADIPDSDLSQGVSQGVKHSESPVRRMDLDEFKQLAHGRASKHQ